MAQFYPLFIHKYWKNWLIIMPDPDILWQDMAKLNSLYEELCWDADDDLVFTIEGDRIIIRNDSQKNTT